MVDNRSTELLILRCIGICLNVAGLPLIHVKKV